MLPDNKMASAITTDDSWSWHGGGVVLPTLLWLVIAVLLQQWLRDSWHYRSFPPGPRRWPLVGNLLQLGPRAWVTLQGMSARYGSVVGVTLGMQRAVVLNDYEAIREAFVEKADVFSARPPVFVVDYGVKKRDIATVDGIVWRDQRRFLLQGLKQFGFGKSTSEAVVMDSVHMVIEELEANLGRPQPFEYLFFLPIVNIIWRIGASHPLPARAKYTTDLCEMVNITMEGMGNQLINFAPYLRFAPGGGFGFWRSQREHNKTWRFICDEIEAHRATFQPDGEMRDIIDVGLLEMHQRRNTPDAGKPPHNDEHLAGTLFDLFLGGVDTSKSTLMWAFLLCSIHPEVQKKVQEELDRVVGRGRLPCFADIVKLPYTEACIQEVHRYCSLFPMGFFHAPSSDTTFRGFRIPQGTMIIPNLYAVHHDPKNWDDPDEFRPERFIDKEGRILHPPYLIPFLIGPRHCPGEPVARMQVHLFFSSLMHKYSFSLPPGEVPTLDPIVGITLSPKPYSLIVTHR